MRGIGRCSIWIVYTSKYIVASNKILTWTVAGGTYVSDISSCPIIGECKSVSTYTVTFTRYGVEAFLVDHIIWCIIIIDVWPPKINIVTFCKDDFVSRASVLSFKHFMVGIIVSI